MHLQQPSVSWETHVPGRSMAALQATTFLGDYEIKFSHSSLCQTADPTLSRMIPFTSMHDLQLRFNEMHLKAKVF